MQRFELVADTLKKISKTIIITPVAKHWGIDEHKAAMKVSEEEMKNVCEMSDLLKMLIYHEYPVTTVTFVQPEEPGEMHIRVSHIADQACVTIQFSPALLEAISDNRDKTFGEIELVTRKDVQQIFYMTVDYLDGKIVEERDWLDYLCEVVE
jgi:hypothetical protein